jgi:hypothetical protein
VIPDDPTGFHSNIDEVAYHTHTGSLSVSGAKTLLKAPALYRYQRDNPEFKGVFEFGSAAHALVLGKGIEYIYVAPFDSWATKAAQLERKLAREDGMSPILPSDWLVVCDMAEELSKHRKAMELLADGEAEVSAFALDEPTGVMRRARFDHLGNGSGLLTDYKTAKSSQPRAWVRTAADYGYHMQHAWYLDLARDLGHPARGFVFIVQEKDPPYIVTVIELPPDLIDVGRDRNRVALQRFRDCTEVDLWPGYVPDDQIATAAAPPWVYYTEE